MLAARFSGVAVNLSMTDPTPRTGAVELAGVAALRTAQSPRGYRPLTQATARVSFARREFAVGKVMRAISPYLLATHDVQNQ